MAQSAPVLLDINGDPVAGVLVPGNIDLANRPRVGNADGSVSTIRSISFSQDGKEILIPTVVNGKVVSDAEAIAHYRKTGQHLGIFNSAQAATTFARQLHDREAAKLTSAPDRLDINGDPIPNFSTTNQKDASGKATAVDWNPLSSANVNAAYQRSGIQGLVELGKRSVNVLPAIGGAAGGVVGGLGGSVAGVGVGGVPGAIGGAALGGAAGEAAKQLINRARGGEAPATSGAAAARIGTQAAVQGTAQAVGAGLGAGMKAAAPWLMQKALKPTASLASEYRTTAPKLVQTLLDEGISVTQTGVDKLQRLLDATNAKIREAVANATGSIQKNTVAARALETAAKVSKQVNPAADLQAVGDTVEQFVNHPVFTGKLSIPEAQAMKQGTYQQIGKKYGEVSSASIETQKALARGLKEEIAAEVPGLAGLNSRDSELMAALDATGRRVALSGNKDPVGFAWVAQHPTTFLAAIFDRSPAVKSFVARGLYSSAGSAAKVAPQLIRAAVLALVQPAPDASPPQE